MASRLLRLGGNLRPLSCVSIRFNVLLGNLFDLSEREIAGWFTHFNTLLCNGDSGMNQQTCAVNRVGFCRKYRVILRFSQGFLYGE